LSAAVPQFAGRRASEFIKFETEMSVVGLASLPLNAARLPCVVN
jgi:hypothetical protein